MLIALFSQYYLRRYRTCSPQSLEGCDDWCADEIFSCQTGATWFRKYNYLLSAGLDGGTQFMVFVATFAVFGGSGAPVVRSISTLMPECGATGVLSDQITLLSIQVFPNWALNPAGSNFDYCMDLTTQ